MRIHTVAPVLASLVACLAFPPALDAQSPATPKLLFDRAHGEAAPSPPLAATAERLGLALQESSTPLSAAALEGVRILYVRAPSTAIAPEERAAVAAFVRGGGSLLFVLDEERRQSLATVGANELLAPFGLKLTADTPYIHNVGGRARAGEINAADRELPYSGGRAVEGGTPFAFQLDREGKPGLPFAAFARVGQGGRVVVMGEGMASIYLGVPDGQRLTGDGRTTVYWGKDSAPFMDEVFTWLARR